jgi:hypothetical protein
MILQKDILRKEPEKDSAVETRSVTKWVWNKIFEMMKTLAEAHIELQKQSAFNTTAALLSDCAKFASAIGEFTALKVGEGSRSVAVIESYINAAGKRDGTCDSIAALNDKVRDIFRAIKAELRPTKLEIAFFPYKYAMSDCLESIWLAAIKDPSCEAYVCPIPYFDKNPDHTLGEMRYEGDLYSKDLPIINWQSYLSEDCRPDIAFIHNPYDGNNYVTCVHPNFFSDKLRRSASVLAYVPYFTNIDYVEQHLCCAPGCVLADKVFVESEKIRNVYIQHYNNGLKEYIDKGLISKPEEKFVAIGSPKYDKIINYKPKDFTLPDQWSRLIMKSDGTKKKVILYNTTIAPLLIYNDDYLTKIRNVLDIFRHRDDFILLWRPHPLDKVTYDSMRPHLIPEYEQIISTYKSEAWGIFDDTPEFHRAMAISDAYYGDWSSVSTLYGITGKPIMIQNPAACTTSCKDRPVITSFIEKGDTLWFADARYNALFRMNRTDWKLEFISAIGSEVRELLYSPPVISGGVIYFPPLRAKEIGLYDIASNTFSFIPVQITERVIGFSGAVIFEGNIYFTPFQYPAIVTYGKSGELNYYDDWFAAVRRSVYQDYDVCCGIACVNDNKLMIPSRCSNHVIEFDMRTKKSIVREVGEKEYKFSAICFDGGNYWLAPMASTPIIKWNPDTGLYKTFEDYINDKIHDLYCAPFYLDGYVWFISRYANQSLRIIVKTTDTQTDEVIIAEEFPTVSTGGNGWAENYYFALNTRSGIFAYNAAKGLLAEYNCKTKDRREQVLTYPEELWKTFQKQSLSYMIKDPELCHLAGDCYYYENITHTLTEYLDFYNQYVNTKEGMAFTQKQKELFKNLACNTDGTAGEKILNSCKELVN